MGSSTGCLKLLARVLALVLAFLVIVLVPLTWVAHDVEAVLFSPETLSGALVEGITEAEDTRADLVERLLTPMWEEMTSGAGGTPSMDPLENVDQDTWNEIAEVLIPKDWFESQIRASIQAMIQWIQSDDTRPELSLDLKPFKANLAAGGAKDLLTLVVDTWPACTPSQMQRLRSTGMSGEPELSVLCRPADPLYEPMIDFMHQGLLEQLREVPTSIPLGREMLGSGGDPELLLIRDRVRAAQLLLRWLWLLPVLLLAGIIVFAVRSIRDLGLWWGIPILLGGFGLALMAFTFGFSGLDLFRGLLARQGLPAPVRVPFLQTFQSLSEALTDRMVTQALLLVVGGALLLILTQLLAHRKGAAGQAAVPAPAPPSDSMQPGVSDPPAVRPPGGPEPSDSDREGAEDRDEGQRGMFG